MVYMYLCVTDGKEPSDIVTLACAEERLEECLDLYPIVAIRVRKPVLYVTEQGTGP